MPDLANVRYAHNGKSTKNPFRCFTMNPQNWRNCYIHLFLFICIQSAFSQPEKIVQPTISVAPLWVMAEYGLYWGISLSGGIRIIKHHKISVGADLAPMGLLGMTDVATDGKTQHWGGALSYQFQIESGNKLIRIEPGVTMGLSSIPYIYGTFPDPHIDTALSVITSNKRPERENVRGAGPELRLSIGRKSVHFFVDGRILFAKSHNTALLTNVGVSVKL